MIDDKMKPLPIGVTGYNFPSLGVDAAWFFAALREAARKLNGQVQEDRDARNTETPNYHEAVVCLDRNQKRVRVVCNEFYPIIAFCRPRKAEQAAGLCFELCYMDCPELTAQLCDRFTVLTAVEAESGVTPELIGQLGEAELHEMNYWKPERIGDVIFNYWD